MKQKSIASEVNKVKNNFIKLDYDFDTGVEVSKTTNGYHVKIPFRGSDLQVLAMQILLGSDQKREWFNLQRLAQGKKKDWNVLFQEKFKLNKSTGCYDLVSKEVPL